MDTKKEIEEIKLREKGLMIRDQDLYDSYKKTDALYGVIFVILVILILCVFLYVGYTSGYDAGLMNTEPCQAIINASKGLI